MAITVDTIGAALGAGQESPVFKISIASEGAGTRSSLWKAAGNPGAGVNPPVFTSGVGYANSSVTVGAVPYTNPGVGVNKYLALADAVNSVTGALYLYDRLWTCSGFGTVVTTAQVVVTPGALPARDANGASLGAGVEIWGEVYAAPGATAATWTVSYTDAAGVAGRLATYAHPANAESVGQMFPFVMPAAGCRSVESLTCSATSGTAGDIGVTLLRHLAKVPFVAANVASVMDWAALGLPEVLDSSCIALSVHCTGNATGVIMGGLRLVNLTP